MLTGKRVEVFYNVKVSSFMYGKFISCYNIHLENHMNDDDI